MRTLKIFLLFSLMAYLEKSQCSSDSLEKLASTAINLVLDDSQLEFALNLEVIVFSTDAEELARRVIEERKNYVTPVRITNADFADPNLREKSSSLLVFITAQDLWRIKTVRWQTHPSKRRKHLVFIIGGNIESLDIFQNGFQIDNIAFLLLKDENSIELYTSYIFTAEKCQANQIVLINTFERSKMSWKTTNFYPNKYENFHGCELTVAIAKFFLFTVIGGGTYSFLKIVSQRFNFTCKEVPYRKPGSNNGTGFTIEFATSNGNPADGTIIESTGSNILVPSGEPYSDLEKMFLSFDFETWMFIIGTLVAGIVVIQIISRCSMEVQNFVFGRGVRTPTMNLVDIFLNGSQRRFPGRNFSRFMLLMFVILSMIIRTCYQSTLFTFLQGDWRKPAVKNIEDLMKRNFTFLVNEPNGCQSISPRFLKLKSVACIFVQAPDNRLDMILEPENKFCIEATRLFSVNINYIDYQSGVPSMNFIGETQALWFCRFNLPAFLPYYEQFDGIVLRLFDSGITNRWFGKYFIDTFNDPEGIGPQVLTMEHLGTAFIVCLVPLGLTVFVFFIEILEYRLKNYLKKKLNSTLEVVDFILNETSYPPL